MEDLTSVQPRGSSDRDDLIIRPEGKNMTIGRHTVNLVAVCVVFAFNSFSYSSLQSMQSSLNPSRGLGLASLSCLYASMTLSSLFISPVMIRELGTKKTMILGSLAFGLYAVSNFFPRFYTIIPSAIICGLATGPNWAAVSTYLHTLAQDKARVTTSEERSEVLTSRYLGLLNTSWQIAYIISTFLVSTVMMNNVSEDGVFKMYNFSVARCGARDCGADMPQEAVGAVKPPDYIIHIFLACFSTSGLILAPLVGVFFIDDIKPMYKAVSAEEVDITHEEETNWLAALRALKRPQLLMLTPFAVYIGMFYSFVMADFTKSFVSCTQGIHMVGYVIMTFATADAVFTVAIGWIRKVLGRLALFTWTAAINIAVMVMCLVWNPDSGERWHLYLLAVALALCDAVWTIQIRVFVSVLFPNNQGPVFSAVYLFTSIGYTLSFASSIPSSVCVSYKLYGLITLLCVSMFLYYIDEALVKMQSKREHREGNEVTGEVAMVSFDGDGAVQEIKPRDC